MCPTPTACQFAGACGKDGTCTYEAKPDNTVCDDGDASTDFDRCYNGVCAESNSCMGTTCVPLSQCHVAGKCRRGTCSNPAKPTGGSTVS